MTPLRTAFISQWFPPEPVVVPWSICAALTKRGHEIEVLTGIPNYPSGNVTPGYKAWKASHEAIDAVPVRRTPLYPDHGQGFVKRALNYVSWALSSTAFGALLIRRADVALVYSSPATAALAPAALRRFTGTPFVLLVQDIWPDSVISTGIVPAGWLAKMSRGTLNSFVNWTYRRATAIAVISPGAIALLESRGVPREKLSLVYNWADDEAVKNPPPDATQARAEFGLPVGSFVVSYAGNHGRAQNLDVVLEAARQLQDLHDLHFLFVGDGVEAQRLKERAATLGLDRVKFTGPLPRRDMPSVHAASDVQLISLADDPLFRITMPSKVQSVLASGTAAIAIAAGDAARVIADSGAGWSVAPNDHDALASTIRTAHKEGAESLRDRGHAARDYYQRNMSAAVGGERLDEILRTAARTSPRRTKKGPSP